jgi:hypothetical protein
VSNHTNLYLLKKDSIGQISLQDTLYPSNQILRTFDSLDTQYEYTVVAVPQTSHMYLYQNNVPTYLGDSPNWQNVIWRQASNPTSIDTIVLVQSQPNGGSGSAGGNISGGPLRTESNSVEGLLMLVMNMNNEIIDFTYSNAQGDYEFTQLMDGNYKIIGEYLNRTSDTAIFEVNTSQNNQINGINFEVLPNHIQYNSAIGIEKWSSKWIDVHPNPTRDFIEITLPITTNSKIRIIDISGNTLQSEEFYNANSIKLSLQDYAKGIYIIEIKLNNHEVIMKKCIKY